MVSFFGTFVLNENFYDSISDWQLLHTILVGCLQDDIGLLVQFHLPILLALKASSSLLLGKRSPMAPHSRRLGPSPQESDHLRVMHPFLLLRGPHQLPQPSAARLTRTVVLG